MYKIEAKLTIYNILIYYLSKAIARRTVFSRMVSSPCHTQFRQSYTVHYASLLKYLYVEVAYINRPYMQAYICDLCLIVHHLTLGGMRKAASGPI